MIGTNASPRQKGTAYVYFHHHCATPNGPGSAGDWGYVKGKERETEAKRVERHTTAEKEREEKKRGK